MKNALLIAALISCHLAHAGTYRCERNGQTEYTDRPCGGGAEVRLSPAPPIPKPETRRLRIIYDSDAPQHRYNKAQRDRLYAASSKLKQRNKQLLMQIQQISQQRERELRNAAVSDRDAMAAINLYWQGKADKLQRQYDRNLTQINRLLDMAHQ